jgi:hypothetical protein
MGGDKMECQIKLPRLSDDEQTLAILDYQLDEQGLAAGLDEEAKFMELLVQVVTRWCNETTDGRVCFKYAGNDLNIGDLSSHNGEGWVRAALKEHGVFEFRVSTICHERKRCLDWHYDSVLALEDEIELDS